MYDIKNAINYINAWAQTTNRDFFHTDHKAFPYCNILVRDVGDGHPYNLIFIDDDYMAYYYRTTQSGIETMTVQYVIGDIPPVSNCSEKVDKIMNIGVLNCYESNEKSQELSKVLPNLITRHAIANIKPLSELKVNEYALVLLVWKYGSVQQAIAKRTDTGYTIMNNIDKFVEIIDGNSIWLSDIATFDLAGKNKYCEIYGILPTMYLSDLNLSTFNPDHNPMVISDLLTMHETFNEVFRDFDRHAYDEATYIDMHTLVTDGMIRGHIPMVARGLFTKNQHTLSAYAFSEGAGRNSYGSENIPYLTEDGMPVIY